MSRISCYCQTEIVIAIVVVFPPFQFLFFKGLEMLETIAISLLVLWALGIVSTVSLDGFEHLLLVLAIIIVLIRVIQGHKI